MEGKRNGSKHLALWSEALKHPTPPVWHYDVWHMRGALHCELDVSGKWSESPVQENFPAERPAISLHMFVDPFRSSLKSAEICEQLSVWASSPSLLNLLRGHSVEKQENSCPACLPSALLASCEVSGAIVDRLMGAAMARSRRPSSSSFSCYRACTRSTGCRGRPSAGAGRSPTQRCWLPPGCPPPEGAHSRTHPPINMLCWLTANTSKRSSQIHIGTRGISALQKKNLNGCICIISTQQNVYQFILSKSIFKVSLW